MSSATTNKTPPAPVEAFAQVEQAGGPLLPLRKAGLARFAERGYPTTGDEDWRFTSLKPLTDLPFLPTLEPLGQALGQAAGGDSLLRFMDGSMLHGDLQQVSSIIFWRSSC